MLGYGAANTAFAGLAIKLVVRREYGMLKRLRSTPLPRRDLPRRRARVDAARLPAPDGRDLRARRLRSSTPTLPERWLSLAALVLLGVAAFAGIGLGAAALIRSDGGLLGGA